MNRIALLVVLVALSGCQFMTGVQPCRHDEPCPTNTSCDEDLGVCLSASDEAQVHPKAKKQPAAGEPGVEPGAVDPGSNDPTSAADAGNAVPDAGAATGTANGGEGEGEGSTAVDAGASQTTDAGSTTSTPDAGTTETTPDAGSTPPPPPPPPQCPVHSSFNGVNCTCDNGYVPNQAHTGCVISTTGGGSSSGGGGTVTVLSAGSSCGGSCGGASCGGASCGGASCGGASCGGSCGGCGCGGGEPEPRDVSPMTRVSVAVSRTGAVVHRTDSIVLVEVDGRVLELTADHEILVDGSGFVRAGDIAPGDRLLAAGGDVEVAHVATLAGSFTVKDADVDDDGTFLVDGFLARTPAN